LHRGLYSSSASAQLLSLSKQCTYRELIDDIVFRSSSALGNKFNVFIDGKAVKVSTSISMLSLTSIHQYLIISIG
jgi:hypothetical protein